MTANKIDLCLSIVKRTFTRWSFNLLESTEVVFSILDSWISLSNLSDSIFKSGLPLFLPKVEWEWLAYNINMAKSSMDNFLSS